MTKCSLTRFREAVVNRETFRQLRALGQGQGCPGYKGEPTIPCPWLRSMKSVLAFKDHRLFMTLYKTTLGSTAMNLHDVRTSRVRQTDITPSATRGQDLEERRFRSVAQISMGSFISIGSKTQKSETQLRGFAEDIKGEQLCGVGKLLCR